MNPSNKTTRSKDGSPPASDRSELRTHSARALFAVGTIALVVTLLLLRFSFVSGAIYGAVVKDPERTAPAGNVLVAPADGTVIYVKRIVDGEMPEVVKRGVAVPLVDHVKGELAGPLASGYLIGIKMHVDGVHVNRAPIAGRVTRQIVFNGPHLDMRATEKTTVLTQLLPGWVTLKKLFGREPFRLEDDADYVLKSARETLVFEDVRGTNVYVVRIADFMMGRILTWVAEGQQVATGERLGMITWGSQTDVAFAESPGMTIVVDVGDRVLAGQSILARY